MIGWREGEEGGESIDFFDRKEVDALFPNAGRVKVEAL
jgi:hypothetical protein